MLISNETWCLHNDISEITFTRAKLVKCNEVISLLKSHGDLG